MLAHPTQNQKPSRLCELPHPQGQHPNFPLTNQAGLGIRTTPAATPPHTREGMAGPTRANNPPSI